MYSNNIKPSFVDGTISHSTTESPQSVYLYRFYLNIFINTYVANI